MFCGGLLLLPKCNQLDRDVIPKVIMDLINVLGFRNCYKKNINEKNNKLLLDNVHGIRFLCITLNTELFSIKKIIKNK